MDKDFWRQRWQQQLIGFHQAEFNARLKKFWSQLQIASDAPVLVPLCGKSLDMLWLREKGHPVTGVELSPVATEAFFIENGLTPVHSTQEAFQVCETGGLRVYCGDFFDLSTAQVSDVRGVYDRAALIALPADMRQRYVDKLNQVLPGKVFMLLVTMEYDQSLMGGPPFSVEQNEVERLFSPDWDIQLLHREDILAGEPRFRERGLSRLSEAVYLLKKR